MRRRFALTFGVLAFLWCSATAAQELRIGLGTEATTMDPHFYNLTPNSEATAYVFDTLVWPDNAGNLVPRLATAWRMIDDETWEFDLRQGVQFHDGTPFTGEDVLASFARIPKVPNSPSNYAKNLSHIVLAELVAPDKLRLHTDRPYPFLPADLTQVAIISHRFQDASTADFNSGKAMVGTGPYTWVEWIPGDRLVYSRNDAFWGSPPAWARVVVKPIGNNTARTAALISGSVDLINQVSPDDLPSIKARAGLSVRESPEQRLMYLAVDANRDRSPFVTARDGQPLDRNPLSDLRVRRAISLAIDRQALAERVMATQAIPAGDLLPPGAYGTSPDLVPERFDPALARRLLADAGWPDGFGLTVHGPNDRYVNDAKVVQVTGQFLARIGIATKVETLPKSIYFTRVAKREFSLFLIGTSSVVGMGTYSMLTYIFATRDSERLLGGGNWGHYSNSAVDDLISRASIDLDAVRRETLLREASSIAVRNQLGIIPLFFSINTWAMRKGIDYHPRSDSYTLAEDTAPE